MPRDRQLGISLLRRSLRTKDASSLARPSRHTSKAANLGRREKVNLLADDVDAADTVALEQGEVDVVALLRTNNCWPLERPRQRIFGNMAVGWIEHLWSER